MKGNDENITQISSKDSLLKEERRNSHLQQISTLQAQLDQSEKSRGDLLKKVKDQEETIETLKKQVAKNQMVYQERNEIRDKLDQIVLTTESLKEQIAQYQTSEDMLLKERETFIQKIFEIGKQLNDVNDETRKLKVQNSSKSESELTNMLIVLKKEYEEKECANQEIETNLNKLKELNNQLQEQTHLNTQLLDDTTKKISVLEHEKELRSEESKKASSSNLLDELSMLKKSNPMSPIKSLKDEFSTLNSKDDAENLDDLKKEIESYKAKLNELKEEQEKTRYKEDSVNNQLDSELATLRDRLEALETKKISLLAQIEALKIDENENIQDNLNSLLATIASTQKEIEDVRSRLLSNNSFDQVNEKKETIKDLEDDIDRIKSEGMMYDNQLKFVESQLSQFETLIRTKDLLISKMQPKDSSEESDLDEISGKPTEVIKKELNLMKLKLEEDVHVLKGLKQELYTLRDNRNLISSADRGDEENEALLPRHRAKRKPNDTCCTCCVM